jgi:hypothetical protein
MSLTTPGSLPYSTPDELEGLPEDQQRLVRGRSQLSA